MGAVGPLPDPSQPSAYHIHVVVGLIGVDHGGVFCEIDVLNLESKAAIGGLQGC